MDLFPTIAHITGAQMPTDMDRDGKLIIDLITGEEGAQTPHEYFFYGNSAVRSGDWKYHQKEKFKVEATKRENRGPTLYNLKEDIGESVNVIDIYPEVAERLALALANNPNKPVARETVKPHKK